MHSLSLMKGDGGEYTITPSDRTVTVPNANINQMLYYSSKLFKTTTDNYKLAL
jgi:hypothetical protein